jgi:hypothetical protein
VDEMFPTLARRVGPGTADKLGPTPELFQQRTQKTSSLRVIVTAAAVPASSPASAFPLAVPSWAVEEVEPWV